MGQVCSGGKGEANKGSALDGAASAADLAVLEKQNQYNVDGLGYEQQQLLSQSQLDLHQQQSQIQQHQLQMERGGVLASAEEKERLKSLREEQGRLNMIVSTAGRGMVSIRSTRGSTGYYDQGFAAALAQHLEQTTSFPDRLPVTLPPPPKEGDRIPSKATLAATSPGALPLPGNNDKRTASTSSAKAASPLFTRLAQPQWEGIALASGGGLAGCAGEDPNRFMDNVAESLLDTVVPAKQQLFAGAKPMVENLL